jgi:hypothetical protein
MEHGTIKRDSYQIPEGLWSKVRNLLLIIGVLAWAATVIGAFADPKQFYFSYLTAFWYCTVITLGGVFWTFIQFVTGAAATTTVRRIMENIAAGLPYAIVLFIPVALGVHQLYTWADPVAAAHDPVFLFRGAYFHPTIFIARSIVLLVILSIFVIKVVQHATRIDTAGSIVGGLRESKLAEKWSAPGLIFLFLIATIFAWEWIMSLDAKAFSTIFGAYCLANGALACIGVVTLVGLYLRNNGVLENTINIEHYHDLGKWMFAVTVFWAYTAFAQYMLIWYANIPEETQYFYHRYQGTGIGSWYNVGMIQIFGHFLFPFVLLMGRTIKRRFASLGFAGIYLLVICYIDVYWMVMPMLHKQGVEIHWLDISTLLAVASFYGFLFWNRMKKYALVPVGDIRLVQSLAFKNQ